MSGCATTISAWEPEKRASSHSICSGLEWFHRGERNESRAERQNTAEGRVVPAYCLHVTLGRRLHALAPGLTPRSALEKFAAVPMIDLHVPTTDGRELLLTRYTEPEPKLALLIHNRKFVLPDQPKPKITTVPRPPKTPL